VEAMVQSAGKAGPAARTPPRLVEAHYEANLEETALVGTARWKVIHAGTGAGLLPLQPLNLAVRKARLGERDALIADFDGRAPGLLVEPADEANATLEWSARGEVRPEGLHFDLQFPA